LICQLHTPAVLPSVKNADYPLGSRLGRPRTSLVVLKTCQVCCPCRESNNDYTVSSIVGSRLTLPAREMKVEANWLCIRTYCTFLGSTTYIQQNHFRI